VNVQLAFCHREVMRLVMRAARQQSDETQPSDMGNLLGIGRDHGQDHASGKSHAPSNAYPIAVCTGTMALLFDIDMDTHEQWQLTMKAAELYERYVARYFFAPWASLLVDLANLVAGERVLDVACGTGIVARVAAKRVGPAGRVVGVDLNQNMIAVARSLPAANNLPIEWLERSALDLHLKKASFDAVLCQQGLQFFPDKAVALKEMRRVLDRGGRLALSVWESNSPGPYTIAVTTALLQFMGHKIADRISAAWKTPSADELRRLATEANFSAVEVSVKRTNIHLPHIGTYVLNHLSATPIAADIDAVDAEVRRKIAASVVEQLHCYADGDGITYPQETNVLAARAV